MATFEGFRRIESGESGYSKGRLYVNEQSGEIKTYNQLYYQYVSSPNVAKITSSQAFKDYRERSGQSKKQALKDPYWKETLSTLKTAHKKETDKSSKGKLARTLVVLGYRTEDDKWDVGESDVHR